MGSDGDAGVRHETYVIDPGQYENICNNMPPFGLGAVGRIVDAVATRRRVKGKVAA